MVVVVRLLQAKRKGGLDHSVLSAPNGRSGAELGDLLEGSFEGEHGLYFLLGEAHSLQLLRQYRSVQYHLLVQNDLFFETEFQF